MLSGINERCKLRDHDDTLQFPYDVDVTSPIVTQLREETANETYNVHADRIDEPMCDDVDM